MNTVVAWIAAYFAGVVLVMEVAHYCALRADRRDQCAGDRQPGGARGEVESVPVHAEEVGS